MTTVIAVVHDGRVTMGADRATNVYDRPVIGVHKILTVAPTVGDPILIGFAGDGALPSVLAAHLTISATPKPDEDHQAWANTVARAITEIAIDHHLTDGGRMDSNLILGCHGRVWTVTHHQAIPHADGRAAVASGEGPALGAVDAGLALGCTDVPELIALAVRIAVTRDRYSAGEPDVVTI